ncbi:MAG: glycosyltransferase family 4 protein [Armatimonadota bacterium]|nr:glycosyltransferase family 4 protein [Armatimonadota bacterium]
MKLAHLTTSDISLALLLGHQIHAYREAGFEVTGISAPGPWAEALVKAGVAHVPLPSLSRAWTPGSDLRAFAALVRLFRAHRFDIVHTHNPKTGVFGRIAARVAGVPVVVNTVHGLYGIDGGRARRALFLGLERLAAACSDFEFCQSAEDLDLLRRLRIVRPERSQFIGNGVDLGRFDPDTVDRAGARAVLGIGEDEVVVGTVGRLVWEKGYREFFAAAEAVRRARPDVRFVVVGPHDDTKEDVVPRTVTDDLERRGVVRFFGLRDDMPALYRAMDIFALASYREGFPRSAVEAAAMGLPMVLTDIRGCREVVDDGRNGFLVPARDARALAAAILRLAGDAALRRRFGDANRERAVAQFDERRIIGQVLQVYHRLLAERSRTPADDFDQARDAGR